MKRLAILSVAALLFGASALAEPPQSTEKLVFPPYPGVSGWKKITNVSNAGHIYFEWIPEDQAVESFHDILVEQSYPQLKGMPPALFVERLVAGIAGACSGDRKNGPKLATEHGYAVAYAQNYCVGSPQKQDVDDFIKVISTPNALYVIQREFHYPTTPDSTPGVRAWPKGQDAQAKADMDAHFAAAQYLGTVQICPTADNSACPAESESRSAPH